MKYRSWNKRIKDRYNKRAVWGNCTARFVVNQENEIILEWCMGILELPGSSGIPSERQ